MTPPPSCHVGCRKERMYHTQLHISQSLWLRTQRASTKSKNSSAARNGWAWACTHAPCPCGLARCLAPSAQSRAPWQGGQALAGMKQGSRPQTAATFRQNCGVLAHARHSQQENSVPRSLSAVVAGRGHDHHARPRGLISLPPTPAPPCTRQSSWYQPAQNAAGRRLYRGQ